MDILLKEIEKHIYYLVTTYQIKLKQIKEYIVITTLQIYLKRPKSGGISVFGENAKDIDFEWRILTKNSADR